MNEEILSIETSLNDDKPWLTKACEMVSIGAELVSVFQKGTVQEKRAVLSRFTSNLQWDEEKLIIISTEPILALIYGLNKAKAKTKHFEPSNTLANKDFSGVFASVSPILRRMLDNVRIILLDQTNGRVVRMYIKPFRRLEAA